MAIGNTTLSAAHRYRDWLRVGIRLFDTDPSVRLEGELISYMHMADLEAAADLLQLDHARGRRLFYGE